MTKPVASLLADDLKTALEHLTMFVDGIEGEPDIHESSAIEFLRLCELVYSQDLTPALQLAGDVDVDEDGVVRYTCGHTYKFFLDGSGVFDAPVTCPACMPITLVDMQQATVGVRYACGHSLRIPVHSDVVEAPVMCAECMTSMSKTDAQMYQSTANDNAALVGTLADAVELFDCLLAGEEDAEDRAQAWLAQNRMAFVVDVEYTRYDDPEQIGR